MRFEIQKSNSASQPFYWRIVASNGKVLAHSETYTDKASCKRAITLVQQGARTAPVKDNTT